MPYGILKADTITYYTATGDVSVAVSGIAIQGASVISGVSGIFTTSVSGATVTGNAGQFTTLTGGTAQFTSVTGVSGVFTTRISGATVTGNTGQFTTLTAVSGVFTTNISGATISGDAGLFGTISGGLGVFSNVLSVPSGTAGSPSISFNGDPNTGLYSPGADQVAISTNGVSRLFVDASGRVTGQGFSSYRGNAYTIASFAANTTLGPLNIVQGITGTHPSISAGQNSGGAYASLGLLTSDKFRLLIDPTGTSTFASDASTVPVTVNIGASEVARIDSSGRLGLGTSSVAALFHAAGAGLFRGSTTGTEAALPTETTALSVLHGTGYNTTPSCSINIGANNRDAVNNNEGFRWGITTPGDAGGLALAFSSTSWNGSANVTSERLRITDGGLVGIGTTSPSQLLHVSGSSGFSIAQISDGSVNSYLYSSTTLGVGWVGTQSNHPFVFGTNNSERARIDSSGRLLVGTSSTSNAPITVLFQGNPNSGTGAGNLVIARNEVTPADGSNLGSIAFADNGHLSSAVVAGARDAGTWSASSKPSRLVFSTTADGASSPTERVRISQNGVVTVKNGAVAEIGTLTDSGTITPDFAANCNFTATISGGSRTLANPSNITAGQTGSIFIIQGAGAGTISWGSYWDFAGGTAPTLTTTSGAVDRVDYVVRTSTSIHTVFTANYS